MRPDWSWAAPRAIPTGDPPLVRRVASASNSKIHGEQNGLTSAVSASSGNRAFTQPGPPAHLLHGCPPGDIAIVIPDSLARVLHTNPCEANRLRR